LKLSVIIVNYNVHYFLQQCLYSVTQALEEIDSEIIVVDNASKDGSCNMVKALFPQIILIENKENVGFSKANNQGVALAKGAYVCILNPDTAVAKDTFLKTLKFAESKNNLGAIGVQLFDGTGNFLPESKRNLPTPLVSLKKIMGMGNAYYATTIAPNNQGKVSILVGAFMMMKKSVYEEVGGFDEDYFMYGEDIDLSYKIEKKGYSNYYLGTVSLLHYKGESTTKDTIYLDRFYGAMKIFYNKHFTHSFVLKKLISLGVQIAKKKAALNTKKVQETPKFIQHYIMLTDSPEKAIKISKKIHKDIVQVTKSEMPERLTNSFLIIDASYASYAETFSIIKRYAGANNFFRIIPPKCDFMLGSDSSTSKGEVISF
jgi:GT2 family glycosyltransferase